MKKRSVLLAVLTVAVMSASACGGGNASTGANAATATATTAASKTAAAATAKTATTAAGSTATAAASTASATGPDFSKHVELTIGGNNFTFDTDKTWWPSDTYKWMEDRLNITLTAKNYDTDQTNLAMASGDLPDLFMAGNVQPVLDGHLAVALDGYLDQYGPHIKQYTVRNDFIRKYMSNGDGKLYFHTPNSGIENGNGGVELWNGDIVRWDLYKQIGAPAMNNDNDYINALQQMKKAYPQTEAGLPVYGMGLFKDWGLWGYEMRAIANGGFSNVGSYWCYYTSTKDDKADLFPMYTTDDSPFYQDMAFYNKLWNLGLMDPDSFIQTSADVQNKAINKQYLGGFCTWFLGLNAEMLKTDPNSTVGMMAVPAKGMSGWFGQNAYVGWGDKDLFVNAKSQNIERCVAYIDMMDDPEANRVQYSGVRGEAWDNTGGAAKILDSAIKARAAGGDAWQKLGINQWGNFIGSSGYGVDPADGAMYDLWSDPAVMKASLTPIQKDFSDFYKVNYPAELIYNMVKAGDCYSQAPSLHTTVMAGMAVVPDDINRIDSKIQDIVTQAVPNFIQAKDDAAYQAVKTQLVSDVKAAGFDTSWAWWQKNWNTVRDDVKTMVANSGK